MVVVFGALMFLGIFFIMPAMGVLGGTFFGYVVYTLGLGQWVSDGLALINLQIRPDQLSTLGAGLGFLGGFFKSVQTNTNSNNK